MRIWTLIILSRKGKATSVQQNNNNMESISGKYLQRKKLNIHHTRFTKNTGNISYMHVHNVQQKAIFYVPSCCVCCSSVVCVCLPPHGDCLG